MARERRLGLGLRQIDVGKVIGCDAMPVVNWEKGHHRPSSATWRDLVKFLLEPLLHTAPGSRRSFPEPCSLPRRSAGHCRKLELTRTALT